LGTFLATANELNQLEKTLRIKLFNSELEEKPTQMEFLRKQKDRYRRMVCKIMEEAANLLYDIINFVATNGTYSEKKIERFTNEVTNASLATYEDWIKLIRFLKRSINIYKYITL